MKSKLISIIASMLLIITTGCSDNNTANTADISATEIETTMLAES